MTRQPSFFVSLITPNDYGGGPRESAPHHRAKLAPLYRAQEHFEGDINFVVKQKII